MHSLLKLHFCTSSYNIGLLLVKLVNVCYINFILYFFAAWLSGTRNWQQNTNVQYSDQREGTKAENYMPRFRIPSGAHCTLVSLFTSVQHCLEMLVNYLVTLSYKPVQYRLHSWMIFNNLRLTIDDFTAYPQVNQCFLQRHAVRSQSQSPNRSTPFDI